MPMVNMLEAKTQLSRLVDAVESGREAEVIIARGGKPAARLVAMPKRKPIRLGVAEGKYKIPEPDDALDAEIAEMFERSAMSGPDDPW